VKALGAAAFQYVSKTADIWCDKEFVLPMVKALGSSLQYASEQLKADREVVLAAVTASGMNLQHAHESLQGDRDVVPGHRLHGRPPRPRSALCRGVVLLGQHLG